MGSNQRQLAMLLAIVALLAAVLWWQYGREDTPPFKVVPVTAAGPASPAPATTAPVPAAAAQPAASRGVPELKLALLAREAAEPLDTGRDPFRFGTARGGDGNAGAGGRGAGHVAPPPPTPQVVAPPQPSGPPPPPPIQLKYIGLAKQGAGGRMIAVLRDDRGIYYGSEGDVIEGRYRLLRVTAETIDVAYVDGQGRRTIPLG